MPSHRSELAEPPTFRVVAILLCLFAAPPVTALTFQVSSAGDEPDRDLADGRCDADLGVPDDQCTLRAALQQANASPGKDQILSILPRGTSIAVGAPALEVTDPVVLIGNGLELNGTSAGIGQDGLQLLAGDSTVRDLVINRFSGNGILITGPGGNSIEGNRIGTDAAGAADLGNAYSGIYIHDSPDNSIGGVSAAARNLISGNQGEGISISGANATGNEVRGNFIGTDTTGTRSLGNTGDGVLISYTVGVPASSSSDNVVGGVEGTTPDGCTGACNLISGNGENGIEIYTGATRNVVQGNFIGTDVTGTLAADATERSFGNVRSGVEIGNAPANQVGGGGAAGRNLISNNRADGILIYNQPDPVTGGTPGALASDNRVYGNYIGTDRTGTNALGNVRMGVFLREAGGNRIGQAGMGNLISGNLHGVGIAGSAAKANRVEGNFIGTDKAGTNRIGNTQMGVLVSSVNGAGNSAASGNFIGGSGAGQGNVISGNGRDGVQVSQRARDNQVLGNRIGTDESGEAPLGNRRHGVAVFDSPDNRIGTEGAGNVIAANEQHGILLGVGLLGGGTTGNRVEGNVIGSPGADPESDDPDPLGNQGHGVVVGSLTEIEDSKTTGNTIGGLRTSKLCDGPCNVISGNHKDGVVISGKGTNTNFVRGNYIGLNQNGSAASPNGGAGVLVKDGAAENTIGGSRDTEACSGPCNVISGNETSGVGVAGIGTKGNRIEGNFIGTDRNGTGSVPNRAHGVYLAERSTSSPPDPEAAFGIHAGLHNSEPWPTGLDAQSVACDLRSRLLEGKERFLNTKGYLFEVLANQEFGWSRSPTPGTPEYDANDDHYALDERERKWQTKAYKQISCAEVVHLLPDDPGVWGLALPKGIIPGDCSQQYQSDFDQRKKDGRIRNSSVLAEGDVYVSISQFVNNAWDKSDCLLPPPTGPSASLNVVGGDRSSVACDGRCNVIGGNGEVGVVLDGAGATNNEVLGNYIGVSPFSASALANRFGGVRIRNSPGNKIGRARATTECNGPCNVISGNGLSGVLIYGPQATGNEVAGNYIGVSPSGQTAVPNRMAGVALKDGPSQNLVGGERPAPECAGPCNVISGNGTDGVLLWGPGTVHNAVQGNILGMDPGERSSIPNQYYGVVAEEGASQNTVGTAEAAIGADCRGPCNVIRGNGAAGVAVIGPATHGILIRGNSLFGNGGLPIDLVGAAGPTGPGPNDLMKAPRLSARFDRTFTNLTGFLDTADPELATVDVYAGSRPDPARLLETLTPQPSGAFEVSYRGRLSSWSATATNASGSTSEFSGPRPLIFIPGVAGSRLVHAETGTELWLGLAKDHANLSLYPGEGLQDIVATDVVRYDIELLKLGREYGPLLEMLTGAGAYREYQIENLPARRTEAGCDLTQMENLPTLFVYAYDWRKSVAENARGLDEYMRCIEKFHPGGEIDVLAHSMGGLLARSYILQFPTSHRVGRLITIGAPWLGAPKVLDVLETGYWSLVTPITLSTLKHIAGSMKGVHQLLPSRAYYELVERLPDGSKEKLYPLIEDGWDFDGNGFDKDVFTFEQYRDAVDKHYGDIGREPRQFEPGKTTEELHTESQDDWSADPAGIEIHHIYGLEGGDLTIGQLRAVSGIRCIPRDPLSCETERHTFQTTWTSGDGTVPRLSAVRRGAGGAPDLNAPNAALFEIRSIFPSPIDDDAEHTGMTWNPEVHERILRILSAGAGSSMSQLSAAAEALPPYSPQPAYYLTIDGAASVEVRDEAGNSSEPAPGLIRGTLAGVRRHYLGDETQAFAMLAVATYFVNIQAASEPLTVELTVGTGESRALAVRYRDLVLPAGTRILWQLTPQGPGNLTYDLDGDGTFETVVPPTASANGPPANDLTPPTIAAEPIPQPGPSQIALTAQDEGSGVKALYYSLDGTHYYPYSGPVDIDPAQSTVLHAFADDNLANRRVLVYPLPVTDLAVSLTASPNQVVIGSNLTYTLTVANQGASAARDVTVQIALPSGVRILSCTAPGGTCGGSDGTPVVTFPSLAAGGTASATLVARVDCSFADGAPITAIATVSSALFDRNAGNDAATAAATALDTIAISPTEQSFPPGGGSGGLDVSAPAACGWTAVSQTPFLTVVSGASGTGNGWVSFMVEANPGPVPRTGTLLVAGRTFTVTQEACHYSLAPTSQSFRAQGGTGSFDVYTAPDGCAWAATSGDAFVTVSASGSGGGRVGYSVAANPGRSPRTGTIHLADQIFTVSQEGVPCSYTITPAGQTSASAQEHVPAAQAPAASFQDGPPIRFSEYQAQLDQRATLLVQSFLGVSGLGKAYAVAVDGAGDIYLTGETWSPASFPGAVGPDLSFNGGASDAFVAKIRGDGSGVVYAGYIGGGGTDVGLGIAVDASGSAYVTGYTYGGFFPIPTGSSLVQSGFSDAFVAKIDPAGTAFLYLGFIGGQSYDSGQAIAVDGAGNAYVTGHTYTPEAYGFPVRIGPDLTFNGPLGGRDAFVAKISADGRTLHYAGYLGGNQTDGGLGIAVDASGSAYVTGYTDSLQTTFPVVGGPDLTFNGPANAFGFLPDAFVAKVKPDGTGLVYCGYLGGFRGDMGQAIAVDASGSAYVTGGTYSGADTFPVTVGPGLAYQGGLGSEADAFVAKVAPNGLSLSYCGYLGGGGGIDEGRSIAVDPAGNAYVTGYTAGSFPALGGLDSSYNGGYTDAFATKVNVEGTGLVYSGYLGGTGVDYGEGIALNGAGTANVAGYTNSTANGSFDALLAAIETEPGLALFLTAAPYEVIAGNELTYKITVTNDSGRIEEDVIITDELPAELTLISASANGGGIVGGSGNQATVRFPSLAPGASASLTLVTRVSCSAANALELVNMATVTSSTSGPVSSNALSTRVSNPAALSPVSQSFESRGGSGRLDVTMPPACDWTAVSDAAWLRITSGGSGRGNGTVLYEVDANGSAVRAGTIRVGERTLTVVQTGSGSACSGAWLDLTPSETVNGSLTTADCRSPRRPDSYADLYFLGGNWDTDLVLSLTSSDFDTWFYLVGPYPYERILNQGPGGEEWGLGFLPTLGGYILEVTSLNPGQTGSYTLTLEDRMACNSMLPGTPYPLPFPAAGGVGGVWFKTGEGCLWTVASDVPWISVKVSGGQGEQSVGFTVAANPTTSARTGTLTFTLAARGTSATATVTQEAVPPSTVSFPATGGTGEVRVTTDADCPWTAVSNDPWITILSEGRGSGNGSVTYKVAPNPDSAPRTGTLTIAGGTLIVRQAAQGGNFYTLTPCRIVDTRGPAGPYGAPALAAGAERHFLLPGRCGIPASAKAVALNVTVTTPTSAGYLTFYPRGVLRPTASTISFRPAQTRGNNAILRLGEQGELTVFSGQALGSTAHLILDVTGYFD